MDGQEKTLSQKIKQCQMCTLCRELPMGLEPLPGIGSGDIMIVLESPNIDNMILEDYDTSLAQKTLFKVLKDSGINSYYITHIMKCHSENKYKKHEIKACYRWFTEEVKEKKPKAIITSGLLPLKTILNQSKVDKLKEWVYQPILAEPVPGTKVKLLPIYAGNYYYQNGAKVYNTAVKKLKEFISGI